MAKEIRVSAGVRIEDLEIVVTVADDASDYDIERAIEDELADILSGAERVKDVSGLDVSSFEVVKTGYDVLVTIRVKATAPSDQDVRQKIQDAIDDVRICDDNASFDIVESDIEIVEG